MKIPLLSRGRMLAPFFSLMGLVVVSAIPLQAAKPTASANTTAYSGRAIAVRIEGARNTGPIVVADTGELPTAGGAISVSNSMVNYVNGALTVETADAEVEGAGPEATADARINRFHVEVLMTTTNIVIDAEYVAASVSASSNRGGKVSVDASVTIQNLTVNGRKVVVTGQPNQVVNFADLDTKLIINEQVSESVKGSADIAVTGLHFWACDIEGRLAQVTAGITVNGTPPPPEEHDCGKVTGGGWITGTPSGAKGTFGMSGGIRRGSFWGHLTYIDHGPGMKVESTAVTGFQVDPTNANGRIITYAVTINGAPGTARLRVVDNGEPGRNDIFDLTLSTGYHAAGDLGGARPGGGNIQVHKCPPGWE
jgi:hypothetical protein